MPQTHRYVCVGCEERGTLACAIPSVRATKTYIVKSPACQAAGLGIQELAQETRQTDSMVGGSGRSAAAGPLSRGETHVSVH